MKEILHLNLSSALREPTIEEEKKEISKDIMMTKQFTKRKVTLKEKKILKFEMQIENNIIRAMFNNKTEVNIFLYFIVLILKLVVKINVIVHIKKARNYKSLFIKYVPYVLM